MTPKVTLVAGILLAGYAAFKIIGGIATGVVCVVYVCGRLGVRHDGAIPIMLLYLMLLMIGLAVARSGYGRIT